MSSGLLTSAVDDARYLNCFNGSVAKVTPAVLHRK